MPREVRKIFFSDAELHQAVDRYRQANPGGLPKGKLTACRTSAKGIEAFFRSRDAMRISSSHMIPRCEAIRILVQLCLGLRIPLPRSGNKTLDSDDGMICLRVELTTGMQHQKLDKHNSLAAAFHDARTNESSG